MNCDLQKQAKYRLSGRQIKEGWNEIVVFNGSHARATPEERQANSVCILSMELAVKASSAA
ncbi:MAG: hypothetical protein EXS18_07790 [Verrucomicrobiae bacterium]|nr:hypothetical protein [Verrucomicrobiae bacterium]